jgi:hypothetical protein
MSVESRNTEKRKDRKMFEKETKTCKKAIVLSHPNLPYPIT